MSSGRQLALVIGIVLACALLPALINFLIDPYQVFRSRTDGLRQLDRNPRIQGAGLIRSHLSDPAKGFDTVIIGTSMGQNFVPSEVSMTLGSGKVIKLNMAGSVAEIQLFVLEKALETGNVRRVLWEIGLYFLPTDLTSVHDIPTFPAHLYGNDLGALRKTIFSANMFDAALDHLRKTVDPIEYDDWNRWYDPESWDARRSEELVAKFPAYRGRIRELHQGEPLRMDDLLAAFTDREYPLLDRVALVVNANPDVQFDLFFPPRTTVSYACSEKLPRTFFIQSEVVRRLSGLPNADVHGFDDQREIVLDLNNYKDLGHYGPHVNRFIIDAIAGGRSRLTSENIDGYQKLRLELLNEVVLEVLAGRYLLAD